jgi:DNA-binding NtrC family response regulator
LLFPASLEPADASLETGEHHATPPIGQGEQILVLDDQPGLAAVFGEMLNTHGYRSTVMTDSRDALTLIKENPDMFALVLTDQTMPGLTGVELVQFLQEIRPGLPVILTTGFSPYVDAATAASMNIEFLQKPVQPGILIQTVARLLNAAAVNADRNPPPPPPTADAPDR